MTEFKKNVFIQHSESIINALAVMDRESVKLLIVLKDAEFCGLVSMGDIQRHIIKSGTLNNSVSSIIRKNITIAKTEQSIEEIKDVMAKHRTEFMPVLKDQSLVEVIFWEDLFEAPLNEADQLKGVPVVIMAGGMGTRLKPLTNVIPKPMVPLGDKTIMESIIDQFKSEGAKQFYVTVNYKAEMMRYYYSELSKEIKLTFIEEHQPLGTGGSLCFLKGKIKDTFFVSNCDIIIDQKMSAVFNYHKEYCNDITIISSVMQHVIPYGTILTGLGGVLVNMEEKPTSVYQINTGVYILEPSVLDFIKDNEFQHITDIIMKIKNEGGRVGVFPVSESSWKDIGQWPEYIKSVRAFSSDDNFVGLI